MCPEQELCEWRHVLCPLHLPGQLVPPVTELLLFVRVCCESSPAKHYPFNKRFVKAGFFKLTREVRTCLEDRLRDGYH